MSCEQAQRRRVQGFTLIELLVVVAILALLISILLPSLSRARAQARQLRCATNLRSQGDAARFYAADNRDYLPRGIQGFPNDEYHIYATCIIKYLGWDGDLEWGISGDTLRLWGRRGIGGRDLNRVLRKIPQLHCPDFPHDKKPDEEHRTKSPLDYVASAMPIPYMWSSIEADSADELEWDYDAEFQGENVPGYIPASRVEEFPAEANPAALIYVTEAHTSLIWKGMGPRFHHFFLASQLPFGGRPRMANDQRHPGGINALFFDGHVETMDLHAIDVGWPNSLAKRLKWFTVMPADYVEQ